MFPDIANAFQLGLFQIIWPGGMQTDLCQTFVWHTGLLRRVGTHQVYTALHCTHPASIQLKYKVVGAGPCRKSALRHAKHALIAVSAIGPRDVCEELAVSLS